MVFNKKEKKAISDATFIALADLIKNDQEHAASLALLGLALRNYIQTNRVPHGKVNANDLDKQIINLLVLFVEKIHQKIKENLQIPEAFSTIKYVFKVEAQIDMEGTTIPAYTVKINVTPEMLKDINEIILKLGHGVI